MNQVAAFYIWSLLGVFFIILGIYALFTTKPVHFWNISQELRVRDIKKYNRAMAKLWMVSAVLFELTGMPLLTDSKAAMAVIPILGSMFVSIGMMIVYTRIEKKYRI